MKTLFRALTALVSLSFALLFLSAPAVAIGAHNPTTVDNPDVPNCTLLGAVTIANTPGCETVIYTGSGSVVGSTAGIKSKP